MRVLRNDAAFFQVDMREHHSVTRNEPAIEHRRDFLAREFLPSVPADGARGDGLVLGRHVLAGERFEKGAVGGRPVRPR
jgi:hypothetical protein